MRGISRFIGCIRVENEKNDIYSQENICADLLKNDCFSLEKCFVFTRENPYSRMQV